MITITIKTSENKNPLPGEKFTIELGPTLFNYLKKISEFIGQDINEFAEMLIEKEIEHFRDNPYDCLGYWFPREDLLKKITGEYYEH